MMSNKATTQTANVVLLCCPGRYQAYLANRLNEQTNLLGMVVVDENGINKSNKIERFWAKNEYFLKPWCLVKYLYVRLRLTSYESMSERSLKKHYPDFIDRQSFPSVPVCHVDNINHQNAVDFVLKHQPDIVCVNGTNLLREPMLNIAHLVRYGIINLHTGLSPYTRGGNCNLHCLLENTPEWIGATVHYIDAGIDSGDIITTLRPPIDENDSYEYLEAKVFIHGIDTLLEAIPYVMNGTAHRVKQWQQGKLFLRRTGYEYKPELRLQANIKITKGLLVKYLRDQETRNSAVKLIALPCSK